VVIGTLDPNPLVAGKAIKIFRQHNIETEVGVLENECHKLNEAYWKYISSRIPFVTLKYAQSLDGKIATARGNSQWISSPPSQKLAHRLRSINDSILVGINTVLLDNPELTTRLVKGKNPLRIVLDSKLKISLKANVLKEQIVAPTLIATTAQADRTKLAELKTAGVEVLVVREDKNGGISLPDLLGILGERNIASLVVEGGATTITSFLQAGLADKVITIMAPKIIGRGIEAIGDLNTVDIDQALTLSPTRVYRSGPDIIVEAELIKK
jgi:diaminohydroxyphosphoribosylaminopyrimidine deaminase/5-amino-6-(5-phosphoribosylamino)uracil reductase